MFTTEGAGSECVCNLVLPQPQARSSFSRAQFLPEGDHHPQVDVFSGLSAEISFSGIAKDRGGREDEPGEERASLVCVKGGGAGPLAGRERTFMTLKSCQLGMQRSAAQTDRAARSFAEPGVKLVMLASFTPVVHFRV